MATPDIKFVYFDARARGEPIRLTLTAAGKPFEDVRYGMEKYAEAVGGSPYGVLPYIVYKGKMFGESKAIASFVARECGMAGKTSVDTLRVDEVYCLVVGLLEALSKIKYEADTAKQAEMAKKLNEDALPKTLGFFEKLLKENGSSGFFVGSALTLADLAVYDIYDSLLVQNSKILEKYPEATKLRKNVEGDAKIKAYLGSRKKCDF